MKKVVIGILMVMVFIAVEARNVLAQSDDNDLYIFGFSQVILNYRVVEADIYPNNSFPAGTNWEYDALSFALHQVNLFFQKPITQNTTFFLSFKASGSYSTSIPSGEFDIPEGWISFQINDNMELKTGLLLPKFNNLNEIRNRLPLFPYIIRPLVYEKFFSSLFIPEDYKPENAYIQLTGYKSIHRNYNLDYAFYIGNSENSYLSKVRAGEVNTGEESATFYRGENLHTSLLFGGRIGLENNLRTQKLGVSFTIDQDNRNKPVSSVFRLPALTTPIMGDIPRYRLGVDVSFTKQKFVFEAEYMGAFHDHSEVKQISAFSKANLNKYFAYSNLTYNSTEKLFFFGYASVSKDQTFEFVAPNSPSAAGVHIYSLGSGYRINDVTVLKLQAISSHLPDNAFLNYNVNMFTVGISTIF